MIDLPEPPLPWELPLPPAVLHEGIHILRGVRFVWEMGFRPVRMDLYLPAVGPAPAVIFIHGGAWLFGDRDGVGPMYMTMVPDVFTALAQRGIAVVSIDYRMTEEALFPAQLHDVAAAQRFVVARADELGIDATRLAVWGESAGGHLAMLLAFQQGDEEALGTTGAPVACPPLLGVVDWYGPTDIRVPMGEVLMPGPTPEERLVGGPIEEHEALARAASPIAHVAAGAPPTLVVHGTGDTLVPVEQSREAVSALEAAGVDVEAVWIDGAQHAWLGSPAAAEQALDATVAFLQRRLG
jgi:acetyl esterase/lipase